MWFRTPKVALAFFVSLTVELQEDHSEEIVGLLEELYDIDTLPAKHIVERKLDVLYNSLCPHRVWDENDYIAWRYRR